MNRAIFILWGLALLVSCDLPGIPSFADAGVDARTELDTSPDRIVCEPRSRQCLSAGVKVCSDDGTDFVIETCAQYETCAAGQCLPVENTCERGQPFALSATTLSYDVTADLKTQAKTVRLENCGTRPLSLRDANVRGPLRPDNTPVFQLRTSVSRLTLRPGDSLELTVVYRPTQGLSHVEGKLDLSLVTDELVNVAVTLRSRAFCATSTRWIDLGLVPVHSPIEGEFYVQNCGSEPLTFEEALGDVEGPEQSLTLDPVEKPGATIRPGEHVRVRYELHATAAGPVAGRASVVFEQNRPGRVEVEVRGYAVEPGCVELPIPALEVLANNLPRAVEPGDQVRLLWVERDETLDDYFEIVNQPSRSHDKARSTSEGAIFQPRVVGSYFVRASLIDPQSGRPSCANRTVVVAVEPSAPLHVELSWLDREDAIPDDTGFGHGSNLDLHVLSSVDGEASWNVSDEDCFAGANSPCGAAEGRIWVSQSSAAPEFASFPRADMIFEVGVYMSNPFNFPQTDARLRIFFEGVLIDELRSQQLQAANDFWLAGIYHGESGEWVRVDRTFAGFPR